MINRIIKGIFESYGIDEKMVDKVKSIIDNIDVAQSEKEIEISFNMKNVRLIITKEKQEENNEGEELVCR